MTVTRQVHAGKFLLHDHYTLGNSKPKIITRPSKITTRPLHARKFLSRIYTAGIFRLHRVTEGAVIKEGGPPVFGFAVLMPFFFFSFTHGAKQ